MPESMESNILKACSCRNFKSYGLLHRGLWVFVAWHEGVHDDLVLSVAWIAGQQSNITPVQKKGHASEMPRSLSRLSGGSSSSLASDNPNWKLLCHKRGSRMRFRAGERAASGKVVPR